MRKPVYISAWLLVCCSICLAMYSSLRKWEKAVKELGCIICESPWTTLHHIHSGSVSDLGLQSGWGLRGCDPWLIIPIHERYHTGSFGIDYGYGVLTWEKKFKTQVYYMDEVCRRLNFNAWRKAGLDREVDGL